MLTEPERLDAVQRAVEALARRDRGLHRLVDLAATSIGVDFGFLSLVDARQEHFAAVGGLLAGQLPAAMSAEESVCRHLVDDGVALFVPDLWAHPVLRELDEVRALGLRSYAGTPVRDSAGLVLGGLCVAHGDVRRWEPAEIDLLRGLAEAAGREVELLVTTRALERLGASEQRRAEEQAALRRVAYAVARGAEPDEVLDLVGQELRALLGGADAHVLPLEGAVPPGLPLAELVAQVQATGTTAVRPDGAVVPVRVGPRTWGVLVAASTRVAEPAVVSYLEQLADVVSLVVANTEARQLLLRAARTDPLTGTANRRGFEEQLAAELSRVDRRDQPLVLALVDVDCFKTVNDRYGHPTGDQVLVELTARVRGQLRGVDLLARVGGDEFALLLPGTGPEEGRSVLERIRDQVAAEPLAGVPVTLTAGLAVATRASASPTVLYRAADRALYQAKAQGRDRVLLAGDVPCPGTAARR